MKALINLAVIEVALVLVACGGRGGRDPPVNATVASIRLTSRAPSIAFCEPETSRPSCTMRAAHQRSVFGFVVGQGTPDRIESRSRNHSGQAGGTRHHGFSGPGKDRHPGKREAKRSRMGTQSRSGLPATVRNRRGASQTPETPGYPKQARAPSRCPHPVARHLPGHLPWAVRRLRLSAARERPQHRAAARRWPSRHLRTP